MPFPASERRQDSDRRLRPHVADSTRHLLDGGVSRSGSRFPGQFVFAFLTSDSKQMKSRTPFERKWIRRGWASLLAAWSALSPLSAAETNAPAAAAAPPLTPQEMFEGGKEVYNNWIELSVGSFFIGGDKAQFQQRQRSRSGPFGGIEDFHYQTSVATNTTLSLDGRALFDNDDYKLRLDLAREKVGYLRFSYDEFRTWYNGNGGFDPPS